MKKIIITLLLSCLGMFWLHAQSNTVVIGSEASGSGGTVSFTSGQVFYEYKSNTITSVTEGVQQGYKTPIATISGTTSLCAGSSAPLLIEIIGNGPFSGTLSDGTVFGGITSPIVVTLVPSSTTVYTIVNLRDKNGTALPSDLQGSATLTLLQNTTATLASASGSDGQYTCINSNITPILYATTGATGATFSGLPTGVSGMWADNMVSITGAATTSGVFNGVLTLTGGCENATTVETLTLTVSSLPIAGSVTGGGAICSGSTSGLLALNSYVGDVLRWEKSVAPFTTWTTIPNTMGLVSYLSDSLTETTQFRAVVNTNACGESYATATTVAITSTTWDGTTWTNGPPDSLKGVVFSGNYTSAGAGAGDLTACSLTVNAGVVIEVASGDDFNISGTVTVDPTATLTFNNNANLLQGAIATTNSNSGNITSKRNASMRRLEYVYWSAPVANQNLLSFSPLTFTTRFYTFNEPSNAFVAVASPATTTFGNSQNQIAGKGFMIRAPNTFADAPAPVTVFNGSFTGVPNNGTYTTPISNSIGNATHGYNLIGNPYPSPIDADMFLAANPGTLYFWTHAILGSGANNYATYTIAGPTAAFANGASCNGTIQTGQGFLILTNTNGNALFTNAMRIENNGGLFFKTATTEKHRIWLNLNSATTALNQIMVGYMAGATQGVDTSIDGALLTYGSSSLSSRIDNSDYVIQGRSLPFEAADTVPLGFNATAAGEFTINLDHVDGLFLGSQTIYLKDNLLGVTHDIKTTPYIFTSASGAFNSRFEIVYTSSPLGTHNPTFDANSIVVYKQDEVLQVNSGTTVMAKVKVFDVRGRLLCEKNNINATAVKLKELSAEQQVLLVQITSNDNQIVTKKVVY